MRIAVFGAGAVGAYFGGRLIETGEHNVTLIARGPHLEALRSQGLRIESPEGDVQLPPGAFNAVEYPDDMDPVDVVFVTVKAWMVPQAARQIGRILGFDTLVVPLQNGVEAPDQLLDVLSIGHVIGGSCRIFSELVEPGVIRHTGVPPTITIGALEGIASDRVERLRSTLGDAGITATVRVDIRTALWEKLLFVGPLGGVGAVTRAPIGVIRMEPDTRQLLVDCMAEIVSTARSEGILLPNEASAVAMDLIDRAPADGTASMQRDIAAGRPSELEAQVGVIPRLGRGHTPVHDVIYAALLPSELKARGQLAW